MKTFNPIHRSNVSPVDIDTFGNTYRELEQGHQRAVQFESALKTEMAKLDLNEAEDAWRQQKIDGIRATLSENTKYGNAAGAVDDLVRAQGDIFSDPALLGRLRAQQDYKTYIDNLDKRTDLSEDYKNYYRARTKYNYQDITDDNGKVVGGTKWQPNERPVSQVDFYKIMDAAAKNASAQTYGGDKVQFMDIATGKISDTYTPGAQWVHVNTMTSQVTKLAPEKIQAAIDAYVNANPEVKASLEQDFKIDKWKHEQNPTIFTDAYDSKGNLKTFKSYVQSKIDPFIEGKKYTNVITSTKYNDSALNMLAKAYVTGKGKSDNTLADATKSSPTIGSAKYRVNQPPTFEGLYNSRNASVAASDAIKNKYPDIDIKFELTTTEDDVLNYIRNNNIQGDALFDILSTYRNYRDITLGERLLNNQIREHISTPEDIAALEFKRQLDSGIIDPIKESDSPELKAIKEKYATFRNNVVGDANGIGIYLKDNRQLDTFITEFGKDAFEASGIKTKNINGRIAVIMPADSTDKLISFINSGATATSKGRGFNDWMNNMFGGVTGAMFKADENNNVIGDVNIPLGAASMGNAKINTTTNHVRAINNIAERFVESLDKQVNNIPQFGEKVVDTSRLGVGSPYQMLMNDMYQSSTDSKERKVYLDNYNQDIKQWEARYRGNYSLPSATNLMVLNPDTNEWELADDSAREFFKDAQTGKYEDKAFTGSLERFPEIGYRHAVNVRKDNEIKRYAIIDGIGDKLLDQLNNSISEKALQNIEKLYNHFQPIQFIGPNGMMAIIKDLETGSIDIYNNEDQLISKSIDPLILQNASEWAVAYDKLNKGEISKENIVDVQRSYAKFLASVGYTNEMIADAFNSIF